jgi:hypothetical protein
MSIRPSSLPSHKTQGIVNCDKKKCVSVFFSQLLSSRANIKNSTLLLKQFDIEKPLSAVKRRSLDSQICLKYLASRRASAAGRMNVLSRIENEEEINNKEEKFLGIKDKCDYDLGDRVMNKISNRKSSTLISENNVFVNEERVCPMIVSKYSVTHMHRPQTSPNNLRRYSLNDKNDNGQKHGDKNKKVCSRRKSTESGNDRRRSTLVPLTPSLFDGQQRPSTEKGTMRNIQDSSYQSHDTSLQVDNGMNDCQNQTCSDQLDNDTSIDNHKYDKRRNSDITRQCNRSLDSIIRSQPLGRPKTSLQKMSDYLKNNKDDENNYDKIKIIYTNNVDDTALQQHSSNKNNYLNDIYHLENKKTRPSTATHNEFPRPIIIYSNVPVLTPKQFFSSLLILSQAFVSSFIYTANFTDASLEGDIYKTHNINIKNINDILKKVPYFILKKKDEDETVPKRRMSALPSIPKQKLKKESYLECNYNYFIFNDNNQNLIDDINNQQIKKIWKISIFLLLFENLFKSKIVNHRKNLYELKICLDKQKVAVGHIERVYYG